MKNSSDLLCRPFLTGTLWNLGINGFRNGEENYMYTPAHWERELDDMQAIGLDTILLNGTSYCFDRAHCQNERQDAIPDLLEYLFSQCDRRGMKLIVETTVNPGWWPNIRVDEQISLNEKAVDRLLDQYGHHTSFAYWYIGYEIYIMCGQDATDIRNLYRRLADVCHRRTPDKPVVLSPFFLLDANNVISDYPYAPPAEYQDWWTQTLESAQIDIVALQDSGGEHLSCFTLEDRRPFFQAMFNACRKTGRHLWGNVELSEFQIDSFESFIQKYGKGTSVNSLHVRDAWRRVPQEKYQSKLELAAEYCEKLITWGYREYLRPSLDPEAKKAYQAYKNYYHKMIS